MRRLPLHGMVLRYEATPGRMVEAEVTPVDYSRTGSRVETAVWLEQGAPVTVLGSIGAGESRINLQCPATVRWCIPNRRGGYFAGLSVEASQAHTVPETTAREKRI